MNLEEYHNVIGWQKDGRLQCRNIGVWLDWQSDEVPCFKNHFTLFRERPPKPVMPDEVYLVDADTHGMIAVSAYLQKPHDGTIRYVRADGVIDGTRLQHRASSAHEWSPDDGYEYRFKP